MTVIETMKNTEATKLPNGWRWVRLGDLFDIKQGVAMSPTRRQGITPHPFLRTLNIKWGSVDLSYLDQMDFSEDEIRDLNLRDGDLLVCEGGDVGRTAMWRGELDNCLYQNHIHRLRRRENNVAPEFYAYWMRAAFTVFQSYKGKEITTTIPNLSGGKVKSFIVPLPPTVAEQERIASILIEQMAAVEKARAAAEARLEAAKALPAAYLRQVFDSDEAKEWPKKRLRDVLRVKSGNFLPANSMNTHGKYPVYGGNGINGYHDSLMFNETKIIIGRVGAQCGCICVSESNAWITDNALYVSEKLIPFDDGFMALLLTQLDLNKKANSMAQPLVTGKIIYDIEVSLPDNDEQKLIAVTLRERFDATKELVAGIEAELETINALPTALLRRAFTGGL